MRRQKQNSQMQNLSISLRPLRGMDEADKNVIEKLIDAFISQKQIQKISAFSKTA